MLSATQVVPPAVLVLLLLAGCLDPRVVDDEVPITGPYGWATRDLRVADPGTYEAGPKRPEREPIIAIDPTNPQNVIAITTEEILEPYTSWLRIFSSRDGGSSWKEERVFDDPRRAGAVGDPSLVFDLHGTAYFAYLDAQGVGIERSSDNGHTWELVAETATRGRDPTTDRCSSPDKELLGIDRASGTLYLVWTRFSHDCAADAVPGGGTVRTVSQIVAGDLRMEVVVQESHDGGVTWSQPRPVSERSGIGAVPVIGPDGTLHVVFWGSLSTNERNTYCASDYGAVVSGGKDQHAAIIVRSWPPGGPWRTHVEPICDLNVAMAVVAESGATTWSAYGFIAPSATVDALRNQVHVAFVATSLGATHANVWEIHSDPDVKTWSAPVALAGTVERDGFLPGLSADGGSVHLLYNELTAERRYAAFYRSSSDGGGSWSEPFQLSESDYELAGDNIGDYNWIDSAGGRVQAIWTGTEAPGAMRVWSRSAWFASSGLPT